MKNNIIRRKNILFCFVLLFSFFNVYAGEADSLYRVLAAASTQEAKLNAHLQLSYFYYSENHDSCLFHLDEAEKYTKTLEEKVRVKIDRGIFFNDIGQYDKALEIFTPLVDEFKDEASPIIMANIYGNIGNCYYYKSFLTKATDYYKKAASIFEESNNVKGMARVYGTLGNILFQNDNYNEAILYYTRSNVLFNQLKNDEGLAINLMNIGTCYKNIGVSDSVIIYYKKALQIFNALGTLPLQTAQCHANIGNLYAYSSKNVDALKNLNKADSIFRRINHTYSIAQVSQDLAYVYLDLGQLEKAKKYIDKSHKLTEENDYEYLSTGVKHLYWKYNNATNNCPLANKWLLEYIDFKDSLEKVDKRKNLDLLLTEFESERKEKEIELLKKSDEINQLKIRRKTLNLYISLTGLIAVLLFSVFLYLNIQKRKRINQLLTAQNIEINQQKEEIISQRDEIESQRDLLQHQNQLLEEFRTHTTDSLRYAQSIQAAILPSEKILQQISSDFFVLIKPCELVSGDFFWATTINEYQIFGVADCTGHGVPGAFMSFLGITALNDIVVRHRVIKPSEILGYLRESVIDALSQNDTEQLHKDGMDIALCSLNTKTRELQFAGAGLSIWIVSENENRVTFTDCNSNPLKQNGLTLCEIKGDIMPVGHSPRMEKFTDRLISLPETKTSIYLATDGFTDQFGGENSNKFGVLELKKQILSIADQGMKTQSEILSVTFDQWKGNNYQVDDVTVMGIKI